MISEGPGLATNTLMTVMAVIGAEAADTCSVGEHSTSSWTFPLMLLSFVFGIGLGIFVNNLKDKFAKLQHFAGLRNVGSQSQCTYTRLSVQPRFSVLPEAAQG